jgi:hypothetical protein
LSSTGKFLESLPSVSGILAERLRDNRVSKLKAMLRLEDDLSSQTKPLTEPLKSV